MRGAAAYSLAEAARYLLLPATTLCEWALGRSRAKNSGARLSSALILRPDRERTEFSFSNLVEAHVLRALHTVTPVSTPAALHAIELAQREFKIKRLLLSHELLGGAGALFLAVYGELVRLSGSRKLATRKILQAYLKRVERDEHEEPCRLYPRVRESLPDGRWLIALDPRIAFGRPVVVSRGVQTASIVERIDASERLADVAEDYDLTIAEVEDAVIFEHARR